MTEIDVNQEVLSEMEIWDRKVLFTELRVDKSTMPENVYCYAMRHGDDDSFPVTLERNVAANYFGSILTTEPFDLGKSGYLAIDYDDYGFTGAEMKLEEFLLENRISEAYEKGGRDDQGKAEQGKGRAR